MGQYRRLSVGLKRDHRERTGHNGEYFGHYGKSHFGPPALGRECQAKSVPFDGRRLTKAGAEVKLGPAPFKRRPKFESITDPHWRTLTTRFYRNNGPFTLQLRETGGATAVRIRASLRWLRRGKLCGGYPCHCPSIVWARSHVALPRILERNWITLPSGPCPPERLQGLGRVFGQSRHGAAACPS